MYLSRSPGSLNYLVDENAPGISPSTASSQTWTRQTLRSHLTVGAVKNQNFQELQTPTCLENYFRETTALRLANRA